MSAKVQQQDEKEPTSHHMIADDGGKVMTGEIDQIMVQEQSMTFLSAVKLYPKAVGWSLVLSMALIMEGYDTALLKSLFAVPSFQKTYAHGKKGAQISAPWQAGLTNGSSIGQLLGLLISGYATERIGFRWTMMTSLATAIGFIFIQFFANSLAMQEVGQVLLGMALFLPKCIPTMTVLTWTRYPSWRHANDPGRVCARNLAALSSAVPYDMCKSILGK